MKIAIQLFGHLRTYRNCFPALQAHVLSKYDCDIFMHTWSKLDHNSQTWHRTSSPDASISTADRIQELQNLYQLKGFKMEDQVREDLGNISCLFLEETFMSVFGLRSIVHSMSEANKLREEYEQEHQIKYDYVICTRPDILFREDFSFDRLLRFLHPEEIENTLFTTGVPTTAVLNTIKKWVCTDLLWFAKPHVLSTFFANTHLAIEDIKPDYQCVFHAPEYYILHAFEKLGFKVSMHEFRPEGSFKILRANEAKKSNSSRKKFITGRLRRRFTRCHLLTIIPKQCFKIYIDIGFYEIDFCIGRPR